MATVTAWKFDTASGAADAEMTLTGLAKRHLITIQGARRGAMSDVGIDHDVIDAVTSKDTAGTSSMFVLTSDGVMDEVTDAFADTTAERMTANLSNEDEAKLREAFGDED